MTRPLDTSAKAHDHQIAALRAMSPDERLRIAATMTDEVRLLAAAGVRARHPSAMPEEVEAALAEVLLGPGSADLVRRHLTFRR